MNPGVFTRVLHTARADPGVPAQQQQQQQQQQQRVEAVRGGASLHIGSDLDLCDMAHVYTL